MTARIGRDLTELYEEDYPLWLECTARQLRERDTDNLDWQNLVEELEGLGRAQRNAVESYLRQLLKHLLLYQYWREAREYNGKGWLNEIDNFRYELEILLRSKTLYNHAIVIFDSTYQKARNSAVRKTGLDIFPLSCPYTLERVLDLDYIPEI